MRELDCGIRYSKVSKTASCAFLCVFTCRLMLLSEGRTAYLGGMEGAVKHFAG